MKIPFFSVYIPSYNHEKTLKAALDSVTHQSFKNFEIIVRDDASKDKSLQVAKNYKYKNIKVFGNQKNLGYPGNLNRGLKDCSGKYIFILAGDDLIDKNTLKWYHDALVKYPNAGAITRPYYWFVDDYKIPVRLKQSTNSKNDLLVSQKSSFNKILLLLSTLDQVSCLCYRRDFMTIDFDQERWISHAYPWLNILKTHPVIFIKKYPLAVRIGTSLTRTNIYIRSPMLCWREMIEKIFPEKKYNKFRQKIIREFVAKNYVGLIQIRNYGNFSSYINEVKNLIIYRPLNLITPAFWLFFLFTLITPPSLLRPLTDTYKARLYEKIIDPKIIINLD
ncbi:MAG: glycosyltransferase family 2 protein [Candidatus Shapirobacteria bacterium]|jgi:glycosyltransferase involved in cell wall biosynthesis